MTTTERAMWLYEVYAEASDWADYVLATEGRTRQWVELSRKWMLALSLLNSFEASRGLRPIFDEDTTEIVAFEEVDPDAEPTAPQPQVYDDIPF